MLAAHGSPDPAFAEVVEAIAEQVRRGAPEVTVLVGYLDHGRPLAEVASPEDVVVPLFMAAGHHVSVDIPAAAPGAVVTDVVGTDRRLVPVLARRLREAGWTGGDVVLAAAGSTEPAALDEVREVAAALAIELGGPTVTAGFVSAGDPRLADLLPVAAISSYLLAPGKFLDALRRTGTSVVSQPIGDAPEVTEVVLDRYRKAGAQPGRTAPA